MTKVSVVSRLPGALRPLSRRLPLFVIAIVTVMMVTVLYLGFKRVHELTVQVALAHLRATSQQLRSTLQTATPRLRREIAQLAERPELSRATNTFASADDRATATQLLSAEVARSPQTASVALWSRDGRLLAAAGDTAIAQASAPSIGEVAAGATDTTTARIAPLLARGDSIFINVVGTVRDVAGGAEGYVVVTRRVTSNPQALNLLRGLVGTDARILLGNADGQLWTDLSQRVDGLSLRPDTGTGQHVAPDQTPYLHSVESIPETPWIVMVEVPRRWATATAGRFVLEMGWIVTVFLIVAALVIWLTIHRSLRPLHAVTDGVDRLARGTSTVQVPVTVDDELGRLAKAFNTMAAQVQASARDVAARATALESSNRELLDSEERYRILVDHLPDGILVHSDQRISFANKASAAMFGAAEPSDLVGRSVLDLVEPDEQPAVLRRTSHVQSSGEAAPTRELKLRRNGGKPKLVEATSMYLSVAGRSAVQTIVRDVTERRVLEEQLRHAQKMDAIGRLAGGVAHDFNNILTVIDAHAEFAMQPDETDATRLDDICEIKKASASASRLTKQLLAFSRKQSIAPVRSNLNDTVESLMSMLERLIGESVVIQADLSEGLWDVYVDASHMEQVIMNLSVNARDAMPKGGTLGFRTANMRIGPDYRTAAGELVPQGEYVLLGVEDSGLGMTADVQSKVFEPFFTTKQPGQGTGLGLATVYGIVKQSSGHIWLYSEIGRGTAFKILLPRYLGDDERPSLTRTSEYRIQPMNATVLLVEDQSSVRAAISRALRNAGFVVHEAGNAEEAERLMASEDGASINLIVTDMMMPGKTGAEFVSGPLVSDRNIPVIIMSGYSEEFTNREWRVPSNASFLDKPVAPSALIKLISQVLGSG